MRTKYEGPAIVASNARPISKTNYLNTHIISRPPLLPTTRRDFFCAYHPTVHAVVVVAVHKFAKRENDFRPLCANCFEPVRNLFGVLSATADERRAA